MEHGLISAVESALEWTGPEPVGEQFARGHMGVEGLPGRLLTPHRLLDLVMRRSLARPQFRVFQRGVEVHPAVYYTDSVSPRGQSTSMVNMNALGRLLNEGATLILDQANVADPTLEVACRALQWWSRERVQVNVYWTTGEAEGFPLHWDDHDVIVVQLAGEKGWEVRGTSRTAPMYRDADPNSTPSEEVIWSGILRAGEVMHIPRGHWHRATRVGHGDAGHSLHVTFGITKRTGASWMSWLGDWCRDQEVFRRDLDRGPEADTAQLIAAAQELLESRPPAAFLGDYERTAAPARQVPHLDVLGPLKGAVCTTNFPPEIRSGDSSVEVTAAGRRLTFAAKAEPALRLLLGGHPVVLADAEAVAGTEVHAVAGLLVREGLCAPLTDELFSGYTGLVTNATS
ncbi:JmjC domain-containing protein [Kitasatospora sp. NPDC001664]